MPPGTLPAVLALIRLVSFRLPGAKNAKVILRRHIGEDVDCKEPFAYELSLGALSTRFTASIPKNNPLRIASRFTDSPRIRDSLLSLIAEIRERLRESEGLFPLSILMDELSEIIFPYVVGHVSRPAYYLLADRSGVMHAHRTVVSTLVERSTSGGVRQEVPTPMLSGVLADFLEQLIALNDVPNKKRGLAGDVAIEIEKSMLRGSVRSEASSKTGASYPVFSYLPRSWKDIKICR